MQELLLLSGDGKGITLGHRHLFTVRLQRWLRDFAD
jgi:hypothetical protein